MAQVCVGFTVNTRQQRAITSASASAGSTPFSLVPRTNIPRKGLGLHVAHGSSASRRPPHSLRSVNKNAEVELAGGDIGGNGSNGYGGGGGDDGQGGQGSGGAGSIEALLLAASRSADSLPAELSKAIQSGQLSADMLKRYLELEQSGLFRFFLQFPGFRERLLADTGFFVKLGIELGIGLAMKCTAEWNKRGKAFKHELDFVFANVVMALIADFMLVWLPAPRAVLSGTAAKASQNAVGRFFASCPDNAFQMVPAGSSPFTTGQRVGAVLRNGGKLIGVGFFSSLFGVGITNTLMQVRMMLDPDFQPPNKPQGVFSTSAAYATYMASSANLRYQLIAGLVEERGIERVFAGRPGICGVSSFAVRTLNTFIGSMLWIDYLRLLGMQKSTFQGDESTAAAS